MIFLALLISLAFATPVAADPVTAAIVTYIGLQGVAATIATVAINIAFSVGLTAASTALMKAKGQSITQPGIRTQSTTQGETTGQTIIFGRYATAGNLVAPAMSHGIPGTKAKGRNRYLTYIMDLADLPIDGYEYSVIDGETVTYGTADASEEDYLGLQAVGRLHGRAWLTSFHDGRQTAVDAFLYDIYETYPDQPWQSDMVLTGVPYIVLNFKADAATFSGFPRVTHVVRGMRLYDPRLDTTVGGSGAQRLNDSTTWEFTENPMVMTYNVMLCIDLLDGTFWGVRATQSELPMAAWVAAMNVCDEAVTLDAGGTEARYRAGLEFSTNDEPFDVVESLLAACGGKIVDLGSGWTVTCGPPTASVLSITDDDILVSSPDEFDPFPGADETYNGVHATYPDESQEWSSREAVPLYNPTWETEDGRRNVVSLTLSSVPYATQVRRLMGEAIADARRMRSHTIVLPPEACGLATVSTIDWTSAHNGYATKLFEIVGKTVDPATLFTTLTIRERDASDYNADAFRDAQTPTAESAATPQFVVDGLDGWAVSGVSIPGVGGGSPKPALRLSWHNGGEDGTAQYEIKVVLPRFSSGLFRAMFAMKETRNGNEIHRRVST